MEGYVAKKGHCWYAVIYDGLDPVTGPERRSRHAAGPDRADAGVPVKVVSERLGHATATFTIETYQQVLPGIQANAARVFEQLIVPGVLPGSTLPVEGREMPSPGTRVPFWLR
jgi:hypothetical protein